MFDTPSLKVPVNATCYLCGNKDWKALEFDSFQYENKSSPIQCFDLDAGMERLKLLKKYYADQEGTQKLYI